MAATIPLLQAAISLLDVVAAFRLSPQQKAKCLLKREEIVVANRKALETKEKEADAERRRLEKKKAEDEKVAAMSKSAQRKYEDKQRRQEKKKNQPKVKVVFG